MIICHQVNELKQHVATLKQTGGSISFVPTMGNLHKGHLSLIKQAKTISDHVIVSIFVNPLQFGPNEDFHNYPRTLQQDKQSLQDEAISLLFTPNPTEIYPQGEHASTSVHINESLSQKLCGQHRKGHFVGVTTVLNKFFNIIQPNYAVLGKKDYQQYLIVKKMVADLFLNIDIVGVETFRDASGLALSSRNQYLSKEEKDIALHLRKNILEAKEKIKTNTASCKDIENSAKSSLKQLGFKVDYFNICRQTDLEPPQPKDKSLLIAAAAWLGETRLIDNQDFII